MFINVNRLSRNKLVDKIKYISRIYNIMIHHISKLGYGINNRNYFNYLKNLNYLYGSACTKP